MVEKEFIKTYARSIVEEAKKKGLITTYADFCKTKESNEYALTEERIHNYTSKRK